MAESSEPDDSGGLFSLDVEGLISSFPVVDAESAILIAPALGFTATGLLVKGRKDG